MKIVDGDKAECDRCESVSPLADVSLLEKETNRNYERVLCDDCLGAVGVPQGYTLRRDISHLATSS
ncbi:hypothetical protein EKH57_12330 [Halorubrum sp. BOL3-1]|uniref:hypothetical protein n=1 Tax=Halorubrum sp. BOL3-1 TaxID=2497325 RepID=UPI001004D786|nr:hypothetical protein [Halorubrum sp. BOL3-1]QAU13434.1 hypothetical protein EKH57_12330 [Halorubrum sp. BOL3-1]